ncbi:MAG: flagellar hook protein FlgE [Nitrospiraceae bacterium]|nr:flagellar hook protein FlgE [Nitrospirota bacterium]MDA8339142.1 flagellar hook protein FlgE [Nitrospiraceae bacterium]
MGMLTSLFTGVSGLSSNGQGLSVVGDNIANSNTAGFKGSRTVFADILSSSLGGGSSFQVGRGAIIQTVQAVFGQGSMETSSNPLDMAIEGDGFFILKETAGTQYYTRAGQFALDKDGNVVNPEGLLLQGKLLTGTQAGQVSTINVASLNSPPNPTSSVEIASNLDSSTTVKNPLSGTADSFTIDTSNNTIVFDEGAGNLTATISPGTYDGAGLATAIKNALDAAGATYNVTYTAGADGRPPKFVISITAGTFRPHWGDTATTAEQIIGFRSTTPSAAAASFTADYVAVGFDPSKASTTSDFSTSITVYDSLGYGHLVTVYFRKTAESVDLDGTGSETTTGNRWHYYAVVQAADSTQGQIQVGAEGYLEFDTDGRLVRDIQEYGNTAGAAFDFSGGVTQAQTIGFEFGTGTAQGGSGRDATTQYGSSSSVIFQTQDGYASGSLKSLTIDNTGTMVGAFTNGQTLEIAEIYLARFIAPTMLTKQGRNLYTESAASGSPIIGSPNTSGRGRVMASSLETSNVDLAEEFVRMIAYQRGFQANTRVITTTDDMLTELMNIKR